MASDKTGFPSDISKALTMLYLQNQDLSGKTPEDITELYYEAYYKIRNHKNKARSESKQKHPQGINY